jgi:hypothetical protein
LIFTFIATFFILTYSVQSQQIDSSPDRVKIDLQIPFKKIGTLQPRSTNEVSASRWSLGCEVLDRNYTDYHSYKEYLVPLGINWTFANFITSYIKRTYNPILLNFCTL